MLKMCWVREFDHHQTFHPKFTDIDSFGCVWNIHPASQQTVTCSKSEIETLNIDMKYVQS